MKKYLLALLLIGLLPTSQALARVWTDSFGKTTQGNYVRVYNGDVIIERPNKSILKVPYWNLSAADRDFVKEQLEAKGQTSLIPPEPSRNIPGVVPGVPGISPPVPSEVPPPSIPGPAFTPPTFPGIPSPTTPTPPVIPNPVPFPGFPGGIGPSASPPPATSSGLPPIPAFTPPEMPRYEPPPMPTYTPPAMPSPTFPQIQYTLKCRKCGYTFNSDTMSTTAPCPSCGNTGGDPFSGNSDSSANAARKAGAITAVVLMVACPLVIGLVMVVAVIAIIFFVVKAVSSPAPAQARRQY